MSSFFKMFNADQLNEEKAQRLISLLITNGIISESSSIGFLVGGVNDGTKLRAFILCTDTKIIARELLWNGGNVIDRIKEYPYASLTGVSTNQGRFLPKIILHIAGREPELLNIKLPFNFLPPLTEFLNSKIPQQNRANNNIPLASTQFSAADEIAKFHALKEQGVITEEEFNAKKKELLGL